MSHFDWWVIEQKPHDEMLGVFRNEAADRPWVRYFLNDNPYSPGNLNSVCRVGFVPYNQCIQDRYFYIDNSRDPEILAAGGIATQIYWDFDISSLPSGWQGVVRQSYLDAKSKDILPNTQVALLAFTTNRFRGQGLSGKVLTKMCSTAKSRGYRYLLVPALPPTQFQKEYVRTPIEAIASLKRKDGEYYDYWIRLHHRKGAAIIGCHGRSHQFVYSASDFSKYVSSDRIESSGEYVIRLDKDAMLGSNRKNMWQRVYADVDRSIVTFDWGCIWAQYDLEALSIGSAD